MQTLLESLSGPAASEPSIYDIDRALAGNRRLARWLEQGACSLLETERYNIAAMSLADERQVIWARPSGTDVDPLALLTRACSATAMPPDGMMLLCRGDGRVLQMTGNANKNSRAASGTHLEDHIDPGLVASIYNQIDELAGGSEPAEKSLARRPQTGRCRMAQVAPDLFAVLLSGGETAAELLDAAAKAPIDHAAQVLLVIDSQGKVAAASGAARRLWEAPLIGRPVLELLAPTNAIEPESWHDWLTADSFGKDLEALALRPEVPPIPICLQRQAAAPSAGDIDADFLVLALDIQDLTRTTEQTIRKLVYFDPLTGLPNREMFSDRLDYAIDYARRHHRSFAVMALNVDRFKLINDSLGLAQGDVALQAVAERLKGLCEEGETVARSSADEFLLTGMLIENAEEAARRAKAIQEAFKQPLDVGAHEISVTVSIGIAVFPNDGLSPSDLLGNADAALGLAKAQGRSASQFFTEDMNTSAFERLMLETRLRRALQNGELEVFYQPIIKTDSGRVVGVEALLRWFHPELGTISPGEFIPLAEETGLIVPIGMWALEQACRQVRGCQIAGHTDLRLAVNISALQFEQADLVSEINRVIKDTDFAPELLELELTESVIMRDAEATVHRLQELRELGLSLAIDDFGTGYSSLAYLKRFPIRSLKIDRSFVGDIDAALSSLAIVQAITALGCTLGLNLVAEGVESDEQLERLHSLGCHEMQGYLFSKPIPPGELVRLLDNDKQLSLAD